MGMVAYFLSAQAAVEVGLGDLGYRQLGTVILRSLLRQCC